MHQECIINDALTNAYNELPVNPDDQKNNKKVSGKRPPGNKLNQDLSYKDAVYKNRTWSENLSCLKCGTALA
jgi:hypothetical protein